MKHTDKHLNINIHAQVAHPDKSLKAMMSGNVHDAKSILELSREQGCMNSQEFIEWQDELNAISVTDK